MLQLTRRADYGLRLIIEVASHDGRLIGTAEVADRQQIPYQFLRKVVQTLVSHGLLTSERGIHGGLCLARPAESISMLDVLRAFGAIGLNRCTQEPPRCDRRDKCAVFPVWVEAQHDVEERLAQTRISELVQRRSGVEGTPGRNPQSTGPACGGGGRPR